MSAGSILNNIEEVNFTFRSSQKEKVTNFGEESDSLETLLITADPAEDLFFGKITVLSSSFVIDWWFYIT